jgi:hypothetical protein
MLFVGVGFESLIYLDIYHANTLSMRFSLYKFGGESVAKKSMGYHG